MSTNPESEPDIPTFEQLVADPEITPLLHFDPVVRKVKRPDGWTPELQRELIARIAATGTLQAAVWQMGKHATGAEALYKVPGATSFRLSWDAAIIIGRRRGGLDSAPPFGGPVPGITRRPSSSSPRGGGGPAQLVEGEAEDEVSEEQKIELIERIANKFLRKVVVERQARLNGEIAAADFYLRQITHLEVMFDLMSSGAGLDAWHALKDVQRGGHAMVDIAETPFSQRLDAHRRDYWSASGEPMRPLTVRAEYLQDHGTHSTEPGHHALGKCTDPPPGVEREAWAAMECEEQVRVRAEVYSQAAADQLAWEEKARRGYEERRASDASS